MCVTLFQVFIWSPGDGPLLLNFCNHPALPRTPLPAFIAWCFQLKVTGKEKRKGRILHCSWQAQYYSILCRLSSSCPELLLLELSPCDTMWFKDYCTDSDIALHIFRVAIRPSKRQLNKWMCSWTQTHTQVLHPIILFKKLRVKLGCLLTDFSCLRLCCFNFKCTVTTVMCALLIGLMAKYSFWFLRFWL